MSSSSTSLKGVEFLSAGRALSLITEVKAVNISFEGTAEFAKKPSATLIGTTAQGDRKTSSRGPVG
jgi:hypothetical protein